MSLASEMTRLQTAKENFQVALEYLGGSVEQNELFSDYPDKFAHMPYFMVPDEVNYGYGYIDGNGWMYENNGYVKNPIDIYKIKQGHSYFIMLGEHIGTRFRVCTVLEKDDIRTKTSGRFKDMAINNENAPKGSWPVMTMYTNPNYSNAKTPFFTAAHDGWLLIQKDNVGDLDVKSYVFDLDTPTLVTEDYITTLDENLFDISNGIVSLKSGADTSVIRGRVRIPGTVNGQTVTGVADHFFDGLTALGGVEFASDITTIGAYAFANTSIIDGSYPRSVTTIGDYAFANCTGMRGSVFIRQNVTSFGVGVWEGTIKLTDCRIYSTHITTLTRTFKGSLVNYINNDPGLAVTTFDGTFYQATNVTNVASAASCPNLTTLTNGAYYGCLKFEDITIPSNITTIGPETFKNCVNLEKVTLDSATPPTLLNVNAFENTNNCPIYVPDSAVSTYKSAPVWSALSNRIFGVSDVPVVVDDSIIQSDYNYGTAVSVKIKSGVDKTALTGSIQIPTKLDGYDVIKIADTGFIECENLSRIIIPNSVTEIGWGAFAFQNYNANQGPTHIVLPDTINTIGYGAFTYCSNLVEIHLSSLISTIETGTFRRCSSLASISIPSSVTTIGGYAFYGCISLTVLTIPNSVTSIGESAFEYCTGLTEIIVESTTPATMPSQGSFGNTNNCPIYVPDASVAAYQSATGWSRYSSRITGISNRV